MTTLSPDDLLRHAGEQTGLAEFGGGDEFRHDFEKFVSALEMGSMPENRRERAINYIIRLLVNRLRFEKDLADHPEIADEVLLPPVAIVSLPRAGTTKLQRVLGATDRLQNLLYWEAHAFARIPDEADCGRSTRVRDAYDFLAWVKRVVPDILQTHPMAAEEVEEEYILNEASFHSVMLTSLFPVPDYALWLSNASKAVAYDYLIAQLKYLQWQHRLDGREPKPWLLKSPGMFGFETELERIFPQGIKFITPHRSPAAIMPSSCRTSYLFGQIFGMEHDKPFFGPPSLHWFGTAASRYVDWRRDCKSHDILDLSFNKISSDSVGAAQEVCEFLDIPLSQDAILAIEQWDIANPRNKFGMNTACLSEYGISEPEVNEVFSRYIEMFGRHF